MNIRAQTSGTREQERSFGAFIRPQAQQFRHSAFPRSFARPHPEPHLKKSDDKTVRVALRVPHSQGGLASLLSTLQGLFYFQYMLGKHDPKALPFARLVEYGAMQKSAEANVPFKDRKTFSLFVQKGVTLRKEEKHGKRDHSVVFKGVQRLFSTTANGKRERLENAAFVNIIGQGSPPFTPNGNFFVLKDGKPKQCSMTFDKATVEGNNLIFTVSSLDNGKASKADAAACFDGKSTSYDSPLIVFFDNGGTSTAK